MKIINCTPHPINLMDDEGSILITLPKCDNPPRLRQSTTPLFSVNIDGVDKPITLSNTKYGECEELPDKKDNVLLIVSRLVLTAYPNRSDLISPNEIMRDDQGNIIGCKSFAIN